LVQFRLINEISKTAVTARGRIRFCTIIIL
jgi:hypothetical protein